MKVKERIKWILRKETEFTNGHLTKMQQVKVGTVLALVMIAITIYYLT
jgi:hypothetical protein